MPATAGRQSTEEVRAADVGRASPRPLRRPARGRPAGCVPAVAGRVVRHRGDRPGRRWHGAEPALMRRVFLWAARNPGCRSTCRAAFMRRAVRRFMPGETLEDALDAAAPLRPPASGRCTRGSARTSRGLDEADAVADHYIEVLDAIEARGHRRRDLGQADPARARPRRGPALAHLVRLAGTRPTTGSYLWIDMEGSAYYRGDDPAVRAAPGRPAADRDLPPGVPPPDRRRHRAAAAARPGDPSRQGRLRRAGVDRLPRQAPGRRQLSRARRRVPPGGRGRPIRLGLGTHDVALIEQIAEPAVAPPGSAATAFEVEMLYGIRTASSSAWPGRATVSRRSSPTVSTGIRGTCAGWRSGRPT